jgi:hypothetical protein
MDGAVGDLGRGGRHRRGTVEMGLLGVGMGMGHVGMGVDGRRRRIVHADVAVRLSGRVSVGHGTGVWEGEKRGEKRVVVQGGVLIYIMAESGPRKWRSRWQIQSGIWRWCHIRSGRVIPTVIHTHILAESLFLTLLLRVPCLACFGSVAAF